MQLTVRVYPGSRTDRVGGRYGRSEPPILVVRVTARAVDGKANLATIRAVAAAFDLPPSAVRISHGATARTKVLTVPADTNRLETLLRTS